MTTDKQDSRAAFEAWLTKKRGDGGTLADVLSPDRLFVAEGAWQDAWQASREQALASAEDRVTTLYAAPQPAYVPLSDAEIESLDCVWLKDLGFDECEVDQASVMRFARAIEQAVRGKT